MNGLLKKKTKDFRISAKRIFLTFSQVAESLTLEQVLGQLTAKQKVHKYLIAEERHQDGGKHFHVLLESQTKFNIRDPALLDLESGPDTYHGNYQEARNYKSVAKYAGKGCNYVTNYTNFVEGTFLSVEEDMLRVTPEIGLSDASKYYLTNYPAHALKGMSITNVKKYLHSVTQTLSQSHDSEQSQEKLPFSIDDFRLTPKMQQWVDQNYQPTLLLVGDGGTGKTAFAKALAQANQWKLLLCNHLEGLKALTPQHDIIVFDDFTFKDIDEQQLLAILGNEEKKQIRVLNGAVEKPRGIKQIITLNTNVLRKIKSKLKHKHFLRRIIYVQLTEPLILNLNVNNVNIEVVNNHTNIYNNPKTIEDNERLLDSL